MPSGEKGYVYSIVKEEKEFLSLLTELFSENYISFIENPQDPSEFGSDKIPNSIKFPGFIFDSKKEVRWYINDGKFLITIISDECISNLSEIGGTWTREKIDEYNEEVHEHLEENKQNDEIGVFLVNPELSQINIKSEDLKKSLKENKLLENAELFLKDGISIFLTLRWCQE